MLLAALLLGAPCVAHPAPAEVGVRIEKPAGDGVHFAQGSGVFLGDGLVLTAAHVVDLNPQDPKVTVLVDGQRVAGVVVASGTAEAVDLAVVKLEGASLPPRKRGQEPVPVCARDPGVGVPMVVVATGQVSVTTTRESPDPSGKILSKWTNVLTVGYPHGNSGGGVFDAGQGCLSGIIVYMVSGPTKAPQDDMTIFIPASAVTQFLAKYQAGKR